MTTTHYLLDGGNVIGEVEGDTTTTYLRGVNLISSNGTYYLYNAHGDVVQLTNTNGELTRNYNYDAFGNERDPDEEDSNPFRYCGEYYDTETGLYYLRARYYDPLIGRFTQEDTHWNTANMIYGDNPQKINEREDALGLKTYSYAPQISAVLQSGNLYVYCASNPVLYIDRSGHILGGIISGVIGGLFGGLGALSKGESFWSGVGQGVTSGLIAGTALDFALLAIGTGGAGIVIGILAAFGGGLIGSAVGQQVGSIIETGSGEKTDWVSAVVDGLFNTFALGVGSILKSLTNSLREFTSYNFWSMIKETFKFNWGVSLIDDLLSIDYTAKLSLILLLENVMTQKED